MRVIYVAPIPLALLILAAMLTFASQRVGPGPEADAAQVAPGGSGAFTSAGAGLPDLVVTDIVSNQGIGSPCETPAGVLVTVLNQGDAPSGPTVMAVTVQSFSDPVDVPALAPSASATLFSSNVGIPSGDTYTADVDPAVFNFVIESDETNNSLTVVGLVVSTLPTCTPTPSATPTSTFTPTATPTGFSGQDTDGDGWLGYVDNCPFNYNPGQENNDRNFIDNSPPYAQSVDDGTRPYSDTPGDVCDDDDDNDGLLDTAEMTVPCPTPTPGPDPSPTPGPCAPTCLPGATGTNPFDDDTDGDAILDGIECAWGYDPTNPGYRPTAAECATRIGVTLSTDTDGDRIRDYLEYCSYGTNPNASESDSDVGTNGAKDGCEVASLNGDRIVNSIDQGMLASGVAGTVAYTANVDLNKDGVLNSIDQGLMASFIVPPGQCP